jgi:hypothetical protein
LPHPRLHVPFFIALTTITICIIYLKEKKYGKKDERVVGEQYNIT